MRMLEGKHALIVGVATDRSIAWGIAQAMHAHGAQLAFTYANERFRARVEPLPQSLGASLTMPLERTTAEVMASRPGAMLTLSCLGAVRSIRNYNVMGLAKASLEANVRFLAADLGPRDIRVNGISAGPIKTLSGAGVGGFRKMLGYVARVAPLRRNVSIEDVGNAATFLCSGMAAGVTGAILYVDSGFSTVGMSFADEAGTE